MAANHLQRLGFDDAEIATRRSFFEIQDEDLARLAKLRPIAESHSIEIVDALYELILAHPETRAFEIFAEGGGNTFGLEFDAQGRLYSGHNGGGARGWRGANDPVQPAAS